VQAQTYPSVEHVVVSDGPDPELNGMIPEHVVYAELPQHDTDKHWGGPARRYGITIAMGSLIAYLDDDDAFRPEHLAALQDGLAAQPEASFAFSRMIVHMADGSLFRIGDGRPAHGRLAAGSAVLHHRELLDVATWGEPSPHEDWVLVREWLSAGVQYASVDAETVDYYPSTFTNPAERWLYAYPPP
jgi:glycosyltransferase involved in cell wall biosynthesis